MKDCKLWLMGGTGNVLFQLFAAKILASEGFEVTLIDTLLKKNIYTSLMGWTIHEPTWKKFIRENAMSLPIYPAALTFLFKYLNCESRRYVFYQNKNSLKKLSEKSHIFGYFQSKDLIESNLKIFNKFCDEITPLLKTKNNVKKVIHIRFGDRLKDDSWLDSFYGYYENVKRVLSEDNIPAVVVTDSPDIAKEFFDDCENIEFQQNEDALTDFCTISNAEIIFIAPSTFSWWASHLASNARKVYMPREYFDQLGFHKQNCHVVIL